MIDIAFLNIFATIAVMPVHFALGFGPMRAETVIWSIAVVSGLWLIVLVVDLALFPTQRMTLFVRTQCVPVAVVVSAAGSVLAALSGFDGRVITTWFAGVLVYLPLITIPLLISEYRRQRRPASSHDVSELDGR